VLPGGTGSEDEHRSERGSRNRGKVSRLACQVELMLPSALIAGPLLPELALGLLALLHTRRAGV
jgi:hypothetical protein